MIYRLPVKDSDDTGRNTKLSIEDTSGRVVLALDHHTEVYSVMGNPELSKLRHALRVSVEGMLEVQYGSPSGLSLFTRRVPSSPGL